MLPPIPRGALPPLSAVLASALLTLGLASPSDAAVPSKAIVGYWHNWPGAGGNLTLTGVPDAYDVVNIAFAEAGSWLGSEMVFTPHPQIYPNPADFTTDVAGLRSAGKTVLISVGGAASPVYLDTAADADSFFNSMTSIIETHAFDGLDIDLEGQSLLLEPGDTDFRAPTSPRIVNLINAVQRLLDHFGPGFVLTAAPETAFVQGGYGSYSSIWGAYLPFLHAFRDELTYVHVQHYNTGSMYGRDGNIYLPAQADFHAAMADMLLAGFDVNAFVSPIFFEPLRSDQVMIGLPACAAAAGSGYTTPPVVQQAVDYLVLGQGFGGSYQLANPAGYPEFRGLMTWSINWDLDCGLEFSGSHRPYLDGLSGGGGLDLALSGYQSAYDPGDTVSLDLQVSNTSPDSASLTKAIVWAWSAPSVDFEQTIYDGPPYEIAAGDSVTVHLDIPIPLTAPSGSYTAGATIYDGETELDSESFLFQMNGDPPDEKKIVAYYIEWGIYARNYHPLDIPAAKVSHINYAFANIGADLKIAIGDYYAAVDKYYPGDSWEDPFRGTYKQLNIVLKEQYPHLKTFISVGGWTWSGRFSDVALSSQSRTAFASSCIDFIRQYSFDGVDIDWEYPVCCGLPENTYRPEDKENYTLLMAELRQQLDQAAAEDGRPYLLTIAAPAGYDKTENYEMAEIADHLDWMNLMTYDYHGAWDLSMTNHHSKLRPSPDDPNPNELIRNRYNTEYAVQAWLDAGVPPEKVVVGAPFYGRAWSGVPATDLGLFQPATDVPPGTWDDWASGDTGVNDFFEIETFELSGSYTKAWDSNCMVPYLYSPSQYGGHFISYDDAQSIGLKAAMVRNNDLAGMMVWEITADRNQTLLDAIVNELGF